ncbi:MAG: OmpA family protein [Gemmatimonadales bacterium]|nr:OmpA family protein [Gemmatimonadales bacterium]
MKQLSILVLASLLVSVPGAAQDVAGSGVWRNYDFVPGKTVWKATDFSAEPVGRFPGRQLEFVSGNMQIVMVDSVRLLEAVDRSIFRLVLPSVLPESFTLEFDLKNPTPNIGVRVFIGPRAKTTKELDYLDLAARPGIYRNGAAISATRHELAKTMTPMKLQVDGEYAILYAGSTRVSQAPIAKFPRSNTIEFHLDANPRFPLYITNLVVAVGLDKLYEALVKDGEFTTRGIVFDSNSDRLRPESTPVLEELLTALRDHPDLRVAIEGHTDGQGETGYNQALSERRAAAVVRYLAEAGIAAARLSAIGKGESAPAGDNATAEGRQQNRRVIVRKVP